MTTSSFAQQVRNLTHAQRDQLLRHLDGERVQIAVGIDYQRTCAALVRLGLVFPVPRNSARPSHTVSTNAGREATAILLADAADALCRAGLVEQQPGETPLALLRRMKAAKQQANGLKLLDSGIPGAHIPVDF